MNYVNDKGADHITDAIIKIDDTIDYLNRGEARDAHPDYKRTFTEIGIVLLTLIYAPIN